MAQKKGDMIIHATLKENSLSLKFIIVQLSVIILTDYCKASNNCG